MTDFIFIAAGGWQRKLAARGCGKIPALVRGPLLFLSGLLVCVIAPLVFRHGGMPGLFHETAWPDAAASAAAYGLAWYLFRRTVFFPGVKAVSNVLFCGILAFSLVAALFLLLHLDYSRFLLGSGFALCLAWLLCLHQLSLRYVRPAIAVVPGGHARELVTIADASWAVLRAPPHDLKGIGAVAADLRHDLDKQWETFIVRCTLGGIPVYHSKHVYESLTGRVQIEHLSENQFGTLVPNSTYLQFKSVLDWLLAVLALPVFLIICLAVTPAILLTSGGPVFYRQARTGYRGRRFWVYKFRTMRTFAPEATVQCPRSAAITRAGDQRITSIGRFLRKYRIDELPQILNILKGEMSWIGPRPEAISLARWYEEELAFYPYRHVVRPGISGWAQINQGHVTGPQEVMAKLHYDFFYIKYLSPWLDLVIALRTVRAVLSGFGAR